MVDQLLHLGLACPDHGDHTMVLESGDTMHRWLGAATHRSPLQAVCQSSARPEYATTPRFSERTTSRAESRRSLSPAASAT